MFATTTLTEPAIRPIIRKKVNAIVNPSIKEQYKEINVAENKATKLNTTLTNEGIFLPIALTKAAMQAILPKSVNKSKIP